LASANLVAYNAATKETYTEDHLEEQLLQDDDVLQSIEQVRRFKVGKKAVTPIHSSRNGGYTVLPAGGGTLNTAGNQGSKRAEWNYTNHHQQIAIEGETIDGTADDALAVAEVIDTEVSGGLTDMRRELVRQIFLDQSSIIATCVAGAANTTVLLDPVSGFNALERGWIFEGAQLDVGTVANPVLKADGITVVSVDDSETAPSFVASASVTEAATDQVSYNGSRTAAGSFEMNGLRNITSPTTVLGALDPASVGIWKGQTDLNAGVLRPLTLALMYKQARRVKQKGGGKVTDLWMGYKQEENFYTLRQIQERYDGPKSDVGSVDVGTFAGMKPRAFADCPNEDMYFFQKAHLLLLAAGKPYWQNKITGNSGPLEWIQGTDSYGSKITYRLQLGTNKRNAFDRLGDLA